MFRPCSRPYVFRRWPHRGRKIYRSVYFDFRPLLMRTHTNASGRIGWMSKVNGSTATRNLNDERRRRVSSGMYIVFTVAPDGDQCEVGKLAVVN
jgi:hypothetical protein